MKVFRFATLFVLLVFISPVSLACGKVSIAKMNWTSASFLAHVDHFILTHAYGCQVSLVQGDTVPTGQSMLTQGFPDIAPELWSAGVATELQSAVESNRLRIASNVFSDGGEEGFWVPDYMIEANTELRTIKGIKKHVESFLVEGEAIVTGCPPGWNCQNSTKHLMVALGLDQAGFVLKEPGSTEQLMQDLEAAHHAKGPWLGYFWAPTAELGKFPMTNVIFGTGTDIEHFQNCIAQVKCENPQPTQFPKAPVHSVVTESFAKMNPEAYRYIESRTLTNQQLNYILANLEGSAEMSEIDAKWFLKNYSLLWSQWVPAERVQAILDAL